MFQAKVIRLHILFKQVRRASETNTYSYDPLNRLTSWTLNSATENYTYDSASGNLDIKAGVDLNYNDAAHVHAVTHIGSTQKYWYDQNGNQTTRILGADTYLLAYDVENRFNPLCPTDIYPKGHASPKYAMDIGDNYFYFNLRIWGSTGCFAKNLT